MELLSPRDLISALESGEYPKTRGRFETTAEATPSPASRPRPVGFCCLGVYAKACRIPYDSLADAFTDGTHPVNPDDPDEEHGRRPVLPIGHWLFTSVTTGEPRYSAPLQDVLADVNDSTEDFRAVIYVLNEFDNGAREFPVTRVICDTVYGVGNG